MTDQETVNDTITVHSENTAEKFDFQKWSEEFERWCKDHEEEIIKEWEEYYRRH